MVAAGTVVATLKSATTALTGAMSMAVAVPHVWPLHNSLDLLPYTQTAPGEALNMTLGGAIQVSGILIYDLV
jgi:hypothetical protein